MYENKLTCKINKFYWKIKMLMKKNLICVPLFVVCSEFDVCSVTVMHSALTCKLELRCSTLQDPKSSI